MTVSTQGDLPNSVRYVKNGTGGRWWAVAQSRSEIHCGWSEVPDALLERGDIGAIAPLIRASSTGSKSTVTADINALSALLDHPSQHVWITFEDGCMWWCLVRDGVSISDEGETRNHGHFWLTCSEAWSNRSLDGKLLAISTLPGNVTSSKGYRRTVCQPRAWRDILRILRDEPDLDALAANKARRAYESSIGVLVARLGDKDFEVLVELILARSGWNRLAERGGKTEGIDIDVENDAADEIAFVQVKSVASQATLDDYVQRFSAQRERYSRMIFAVHSPSKDLSAPSALPVKVWNNAEISRLVVKHGLGDWISSRL